MKPYICNTPVALIIFNRPAKVKQSIAAIQQVKPKELFVIADGPRQNNSEDPENCAMARSVIETIDWECRIHKNYAEYNLGCSKRVVSGLDWVFEITEEAIIIEDDCIPNTSFFQFCEDLLLRYRYDHRIFSITGQNVQFGQRKIEYDYYFSRYSHSWGWATWRRAWKHFDYEMTCWPEIREQNLLRNIFDNQRDALSWQKTFDYVLQGENIDAWDFRWFFTCLVQNGLNITSAVNLVTNIGLGPDATHTFLENPYLNRPAESVSFPLKHPPLMIRDAQADKFTQRSIYNYYPTLIEKVINKLKVQKLLT